MARKRKRQPQSNPHRDHERRAAIDRLTEQRNGVINHLGALDDLGRVEAAALIEHFNAVLDDLNTAIVPEPRLNTLQRRFDAFQHAPEAARARVASKLERTLAPYRRGRGAGYVGWHPVVTKILKRNPKASFPQVWEALCRLAQQDDDVMVELVIEKNDPACAEVVGTRKHPPRMHLHWRDDKDRIVGPDYLREYLSAQGAALFARP